jgi:hypothetical protein
MEEAARISYRESLNSYLDQRVVQKGEYWCQRGRDFLMAVADLKVFN